ncbi:MAG: dephospho-CoA kinase [bacterium]
MIIGLTGPIAAGKDTVAKILKKHGAIVIDADKLAHTLYSPEVLKVFGTINRKKLGAIVFADKKKLRLLNQIIHPALKKKIESLLSNLTPSAYGLKPFIVINAAVLKEIGLTELVDKVWVVVAPKAVRLQRLMAKGLTKQEALLRINSQRSQKDYLKAADVVIDNSGTKKELDGQIRASL